MNTRLMTFRTSKRSLIMNYEFLIMNYPKCISKKR